MRDGDVRFAGLLAPQGKIQSDFFLYRVADGFFLDGRRDGVDGLVKRLMFYRLRAKVDLENVSSHYGVLALWNAASGDIETVSKAAVAGGTDPRVTELGQRYIVVLEPKPRLSLTAVEAKPGAYHRHRVSMGVPEIGLDYQPGDTFAHEANYDLLNGVNHAKGCYVGQEVVSRMRHKASVRTRVLPIEASEALPEAGTEVKAGTVPIGKLGSSDGRLGLATLRIDRLQRGYDAGDSATAGTRRIWLRQPAWLTIDLPNAPDSEA